MKRVYRFLFRDTMPLVCVLLLHLVPTAGADELVIESFDLPGRIIFNEVSNARTYRVEWSPAADGAWSSFASAADAMDEILASGSGVVTASVPMLYRVVMMPYEVFIPGGSNGGTNPLGSGESHDPCLYPETYSISVDAFYMGRCEITNDEMVMVMQWAHDHNPPLISVSSSTVQNAQGDAQELLDLDDPDCRISWDGSRFGMKEEKGSGYPCVQISWHGAAAYCNYRSLTQGLTPCYSLADWSCDLGANGYRLPTGEEWEYAARGGVVSRSYPWGGDTISHDQANYEASDDFDYDLSSGGWHPAYAVGVHPHTSPVGAFGEHGYGLCDMAGNVWEWCQDWHSCWGSHREIRGGSWRIGASWVRVGLRAVNMTQESSTDDMGFRTVRSAGP